MNSRSLYIIESNTKVSIILMIIFIILSAVMFAKFRRDNEEKDKKLEYHGLVFSLIFLGFSLWLYISDYHAWHDLKRNSKETIGTTIKRICPAKGGCYINFKYVVEGKTYNSGSGYTYNGSSIKGINEEGGKYVVIYNSNDPSFAVMDFKRKVETTSNKP